MARAKRHYIPGYIWHITHRCHKREFLLKFTKDRHRYLQWLYQARKRYGLTILNYMVTSNHIHLLVADTGDRDVIPNSMQLVAGRTGQEYNKRKDRKGAYWEDRYHATAVESGDHLARCMVYIDTNMVRAGVGSKSFIENVKACLGFRAKERDVIEGGEGYQLRESPTYYKSLFEAEKDNIGIETLPSGTLKLNNQELILARPRTTPSIQFLLLLGGGRRGS